MGVGDSLEAALLLAGPIPAGTWHLIGDGIVLSSTDVRYEVLWRHAASDTPLAEFRHHFDPLTGPNPFDATGYESDGAGLRADARAGDRLVLRFSASGPDGGVGTVFIPNGDGEKAHGRIPSLTLPH